MKRLRRILLYNSKDLCRPNYHPVIWQAADVSVSLRTPHRSMATWYDLTNRLSIGVNLRFLILVGAGKPHVPLKETLSVCYPDLKECEINEWEIIYFLKYLRTSYLITSLLYLSREELLRIVNNNRTNLFLIVLRTPVMNNWRKYSLISWWKLLGGKKKTD